MDTEMETMMFLHCKKCVEEMGIQERAFHRSRYHWGIVTWKKKTGSSQSIVRGVDLHFWKKGKTLPHRMKKATSQ